MNLRDFRLGWRSLAQEPMHSFVAILGLAIGFAAFLLLAAYVRYSTQYNASVPHVEQVYVVKHRNNVDLNSPWFDQAPLLLRTAAARLPGVSAATAYIPARPVHTGGLVLKVDGKLHPANGLIVLAGFAEILGLQAAQGDIQAALSQPDTFALTEDAALRLFGTARALGRTVQAEGMLLRVGAVLHTPPPNTTVAFDTLFGPRTALVDDMMRTELATGEMGWWGKLLLRVQPGVSPEVIAAALQQAADGAPALNKLAPEVRQRLGGRKPMDVALSPLADAYFDSDIAGTHLGERGERGNRAVVTGLGALAVLILALAAFNYVNLAAVRMLRRQREVAMRKVLGAGVRRLVLQLLAESLLVSLLATGLGLLLAVLALPSIAQLVGRPLESVLSPAAYASALGITVLLGVLTALYPAWIALKVHPAQALSGKGDSESLAGLQLRRAATVLQIGSAISLAGITLAVAWQTGFAMRASPGFDPGHMLVVDLPEPVAGNAKALGFIAALKAKPEIAGVAVTVDAVGRQNLGWSRDLRRPGGTATVSVDIKSVSANFFSLHGVAPQAGRLFDARLDREDDPEPAVINAIAARQLGFASPQAAVGQPLIFTGPNGRDVHKRVVGIAPELRFRSLREAPRPVAYALWSVGTTLAVRGNVPLPELERIVRTEWPHHFPDAIPSMQSAVQVLDMNYDDDARLARLLAAASGVALALAVFGTYALAAHTVQRRAKEIVLRKLHGAGGLQIGMLVLKEFGALVLIAAALATPLMALAIERYLAGYVERAPIGYLPLLAALSGVGIVALLAVVRHVRAAMSMAPADVLRAA